MPISISQPAYLDEHYWRAAIEREPVWRLMTAAQRASVLAMPVLQHTGQNLRGEITPEAIERTEPMQKIIRSLGHNPADAAFHLLFRLMQVCHAGGDILGPTGFRQDAIARHLGAFVLSPASRSEYKEPGSRLIYSFFQSGGKPGIDSLDYERFNSRLRLEAFLAIKDGDPGLAWEKEFRSTEGNSFISGQFSGTHVTTFARQMLKALVDAGQPMAFQDWIDGVSFDEQKQTSLVAKAVRGLVQHVLVVIDYDRAGSCLRVGLWPELARRMAAAALPKPPPPPAVAAPSETHHAFMLPEDMAVVVSAAGMSPLRIKGGNPPELYAADARKLATRLKEVPAWADKEEIFSPEVRVQVAADVAAIFGLLEQVSQRSRDLKPSKDGWDWLKLDDAARARRIMDILRGRTWKKCPGSIWNFTAAHGDVRRTLTGNDCLPMEHEICAAWKSAPDDGWLELDGWLDYLAAHHNPIAAAAGPAARVFLARVNAYRNIEWDKRDADQTTARAREGLLRFCTQRLLTLGGVEVGRMNGSKVAIRLTPYGRYFLGGTRDFPEASAAATGRIVLQPNYEIVFLGRNLAAETLLGQFCERLGEGTGTLFRLTRASFQDALHRGMTLGSITAALRETCGHSLPANVLAELKAWADARRTFAVHKTLLLRCADKATAVRIHGIMSPGSTIIADGILELCALPTTARLRKLAKLGIYPESMPGTRDYDADDDRDVW